MKSISYIVKSILNVGILAILIMFQPEIRRALEKAGRTKLGVNLFNFSGSSDELTSQWNNAIEAICDSCMDLSSTKTGALIVIERQTKLGEQIANGTIINAKPSKELFGNIFYPNTPLHDGAVIIRDGIILAAACFLPKPQKEELINKKLGSVAENGVLVRDFTRFRLNEYLHEAVIPKPVDSKKKLPVRKGFRSKGDGKK